MGKDKNKLKRKLMELLFSSSEDENEPKKRRNRIISDSDSDSPRPQMEENKQLPEDFLEKIGHVAKKDHSFQLDPNIVSIWKTTMTKGLENDIKQKLIKDMDTIKDLCTEAPKLNSEIQASLSQNAVTRDNHLCEKQNQIGAAICGLSKLLNKLLESNDTANAENLSNCIRILCDVHYLESKTRRAVILPGLNKNVKDTLEKTEITELLFGKNVSDVLKESKTIEKSKKELRPALQSLNNWGPSAYKRQGGHIEQRRRVQRPDVSPAAHNVNKPTQQKRQQQRQYLRNLTRDKPKPHQYATRNQRRRPD